MRAAFFRAFVVAGIAAAAAGATAATASAQSVAEADLKAAFLANFARFTDWPADALGPSQVFTFCVLGDRKVAAALERTLKTHPSGVPLSVMQVKADDSVRRCHLLYIAEDDSDTIAQTLEMVKGAAIFTVGDTTKFAARGGVAQLIEESGRIRFAINPAAAQRGRLALNAQLLSLATLVKDDQ